MRKKRSTFSISRATVRAEPGLMKFASRLLSAGEVCIPPPCISHSTRGSDLKGSSRDLPSGPGAKTPCSQSWGPEPRLNPWVRKISWRKQWQPTPVILPGKSHGRRNPVGYSPWGRKESDTTSLMQPEV